MKKFSILILVFLLVFVTSNLLAQTTILKYKKGIVVLPDKYLKIFLATADGSASVDPESIANSSYSYFCYKPSGNWEIKDKDVKGDLKKIKIKQNGNYVLNSGLKPIMEYGKIIMVVASFPKIEISFSKSLVFCNELDSSQPISIKENLWPNYQEYSQYYTEGSRLLEEKEYLKAFENLKHFLTDDEKITGFLFYAPSRKLIKKAIKDFLHNTGRFYDNLKLKLKEFKKSVGESKIAKLDSLYNSIAKFDSLYNSLIKSQQIFSFYFDNVSDDESMGWKQELDELVFNIGQTLSESEESFKAQKLSLFEVGAYSQDRFKLFVDLLARIFCYKEFFVMAFICLNTLMMILLFLNHGHMSRRHTFPLVAMTVFYIPAGLNVMAKWWCGRTKKNTDADVSRMFFILLAVGVGICLPKLLGNSSDKEGYLAAADWIGANTAEDAVIAVPDSRISFYAEREGLYLESLKEKKGGDYYVEIVEGDEKGGEVSYWVDEDRKKKKVVVCRNSEK